jgi:hypothetical protein
MKVGQINIGRWVSKLVNKSTTGTKPMRCALPLQVLEGQQLRQVSGGSSGASQGPRGGW